MNEVLPTVSVGERADGSQDAIATSAEHRFARVRDQWTPA
jgi:hypothetical protein